MHHQQIDHIGPSDLAGIDAKALASVLVEAGHAKRDVGKLVLVASSDGAYVERREVFASRFDVGTIGRRVERARTGHAEIVVVLVRDEGVELRRMNLGGQRAAN